MVVLTRLSASWFFRLHRRIKKWAVALFLASVWIACAPAQQPLQFLHRHVRSEITSGRAHYVGALSTDSQLSFSIVLTLRNQDELTALLGRLYNPTSPDYHHFLSVADFTDRFAPTAADYQSVVAFAQANGLTVASTAPNRLVVPVTGSVAQINQAFHITMGTYQHPTKSRTFFSPDREPSVALSVPIGHIAGLNNFSLPLPHVKQPQAAARAFDVNGSGPGGSYLASDMRTAYYGNGTLNGSGQAVGLLEFDGYNLSDVNLTFSNAGQSSSVPINNVLLDGASGSPYGPTDGDEAEVVLDIVQALGIAPGLSQVRVYIGTGNDDANILNSIATENIAKQISCSWGWQPDDPATDDVFFAEFAAQGQSFFAASGDDGAFDAAINPYFYPGEDAYVTAVGGTHLSTSETDGSWVSETAWNSYDAGSGGGVSPDGIAIPSWQTTSINASNAGSNTLRNVPDVAMEGDFDNYICTLGNCYGDFAGTSFAAPRWAGFAALINQQAVEAGTAPTGGIGFLNPAIYQIANGSNYIGDFHDITVGNNDTENQPVWFNAVSGYDLVTGLGSATGQNLINDLAGPQVPGFWLYSSGGTISVNQGASNTATFTVADAGGFSGNVTLAITSQLPNGVTAAWGTNPTSGTSVLTVTASSSATAGTVVLTITGTSGNLTASTDVKLAVHGPTFLLTPSASSLSLNLSGTATSSVLVTPEYGFSGNVNLSISGLPTGVTASWSANPTSSSSVLTLTAGSTATGGTANLTITGTSGSLTVTSNLSVTVYAPAFQIEAGGSVSIGQGSSYSTSLYVYPEYGFAGAVNLSIAGLPSGVTASFSQNPITGYSYNSLTFTVSSSAATGQYPLTITGTSGSLTETATLTLGIFAPTFSLATSSPVNIGQGTSATSTVYVSALYGFASNVNLSISGLPVGVTASMVPNPTTYSTVITFTSSNSAVIGQYPLTVTGTSGSLTKTTTLTLGVYTPTFTLSSGPGITVGQGAASTNSVIVQPLYGFTGTVNLSVSGLPGGVTASFLPNPTTTNSTLSLTASSSTAVGQYTVTVSGVSGNQTATTTFLLTIAAPGFTLSGPSSLNLGQGSSAAGAIYVTNQNGFSGNVSLSVSGLPSGVTASFSPNPTGGALLSSTLTLAANSSAIAGQYTLTITGTSGSLVATTTITVMIGAPAFTLTAQSTLSVGQGGSAADYIYLNAQYGFTGNVSLSVSGLPAGVTASFAPNPTTYSSELSLNASSSAALGQYTVTVTGTSGSLSATTTFTLTIGAPSFTVSGPSTLAIGQGSTANGYFYITSQYNFSGNVNMTVSGLPTGVTATFSPNPTTYSSTLTLTATSSAVIGQYSLTILGASGGQSAATNVTLSIYTPTFSLNAPTNVSVGQGASSNAYVSIISQYNFSNGVNLAISGLPIGVTASFSPNPTTGSTTLTFTAGPTVALGQYPLTITGTSGTQTATATTTLTVYAPAFTISSNSVSVGEGISATTSVYVTPLYGFTGSVNLSVSGLPSGVTASLTPNPTTSSSTLAFSASSSASQGQYPITITGTSGTQTTTTSIVLSVYAPTFTLSGAYGAVTLSKGSSITSSVSINPEYGFTGYVALSVSGLPSGVTASFTPNPVTTGSTLTLTASSSAVLGQYTAFITGTSGTQTVTTPFTVGIYNSTFTLTSYSGSISMGPGTSSTAYFYVQDQYGFTGAVNLSASGLPAGVTASFSPNPTTNFSTLTLTASSSAPVGQFTLTITGTYGTQTTTFSIPVTINVPSFTLSGSTTLSIGSGNSTTTSITIDPQYGFNSSVGLSVSGLPAGITASFSPNPTTGSSTLTLTANSAVALGQYPLTITGISGTQAATLTTTLGVYAPTYTLSGAASFTLGLGSSTTGYFYVASGYGFSGNVSFSVSGLPSGVTASFSPNPTTNSTMLTLTASSAVPLGQYSLTINGASGTQIVTIPATLAIAAPAFTLYSGGSVGVGQAGTGSSYVLVQGTNGFTGNVNFSISGLPSGVTASFSPNPTTYETMLTLTASSSAPLGQYNATVTGTSGALTATSSTTVGVYAPGFTISNYQGVTLNQGGSGTDSFSIVGEYGFNGPITLSASGLPSGVTASFSPNPATVSSTLTLTASASALPGPAVVTITGISGALTASTTANITVNASTFALADAPSEVALPPSGSTKSTVSVVPLNGYSGSVNLSISGLPAGVTGTFSPASTSSSSMLTLTASPSAAVGSSAAIIFGSSGSVTATQPLQVVIRTAPTASTTALTVSAAGSPVTSIATGTPVTLTAVVTSGSTPLSVGQVIFCNAAATDCGPGSMLGAAQLTSAGSATLTFIPGSGSQSYKAIFAGNSAVSGSFSTPSNLTVTSSLATSTTITQSGSPGQYSLTATVSGQGPIQPNGTVSFLDTSNANNVLGTATLVPGQTILSSTASQISFTNSPPYSVAVGDFNGDGIPDLAVVYQTPSPGGVSILLGNGDGTFRTGNSLTPSGTPSVVVAGDFNGDGKLDLAVANQNPNSLSIYLGNGDGTFSSTAFNPQISTSMNSIAIGDLNGDGVMDLAMVGTGSNNVSILLGNGDGTFTPASSSPATGSYPHSVAMGDFNGDGVTDLAVANEQSNSLTILLGNRDGTFTPSASSPATGSNPYSVVVGDFNGDGIQDLAVANVGSSSLTILLGNGDGTFTPSSSSTTVVGNPYSIAVADFNGDSIQDLAVTNNYGSTASILLGKGNGTFTVAENPTTGSSPGGVFVGDFNGDGTEDLITQNYGGSLTVLLTNLGQTATATASNISPVGQGSHIVDASYLGNGSYKSSVSGSTSLPGQDVTPSVSVTPSLSGITTLQGDTITVAVNGGTGNPTATGSVVLVSGTYTSPAVTLSKGTATIAIPASTLTAGTHTLAATYTPDATSSVDYNSASGSGSVSVSLATPGVTVTPSSSNITTAQALNIAVAISGGSGAPTPTGSVVLAGSNYISSAATLSGGTASISIPAGSLPVGADSVTVTYTPDTAGSATYSSSTGTNSVTVSKATPTVTVTPSSSGITATQGFSVTVAISAGTGSPAATGSVVLNSGGYTSAATPLTAGVATINVAAGTLPLGNDNLSVSYIPDNASASIYNSAAGSSTVTVSGISPSTITATPSTANITNLQTVSVAISLTGTAGLPTGSITLTSGTYSAQQSLSNGVATFTIPAGALSAGADTLSASYSGNSIYNPAIATATVTMDAVIASASAPSAVFPGTSATSTLTLTAGSNYSGTMDLSCTLTTYPAGAQDLPTCALGTSTVQLSSGGSGTDSITMNTSAASSAANLPPSRLNRRSVGYGIVLAFILMFGNPMRRRRLSLWMVLLSILSIGVIGCGGAGASSGGGGGGSQNPGTTAGTYTFKVSGTDAANSTITTSVNLTMTVQ